MELSSGAYHFELIEFRHLQLAGTQTWALNPLGLCPQAQTPIIAPHSPGFTVPPPPGSYLYHWCAVCSIDGRTQSCSGVH